MHRTLFLALVAMMTLSGHSVVRSQDKAASPWKVLKYEEALFEQLARHVTDTKRAQNENRLAEDMEVLASIFQDKIDFAYAVAARGPWIPHHHLADFFLGATIADPPSTTVAHCGDPLAEYIPGHGIVVQIRVPSPRSDPVTNAKQGSEKKPLSHWEQTRRRLRGEGDRSERGGLTWVECQKCHVAVGDHAAGSSAGTHFEHFQRLAKSGQTGPPTKTALLHTLLETLAENGHNVRDLQLQERITISLSYSLEDDSRSQEQAAGQQEHSEQPAVDSKQEPSAPTPEKESPAPQTKQPLSTTERNLIDEWIRKESSVTEDRRQMARRVYLDLLGRLATTQEIREFVDDSSADSYDRLVDRLLKSDEGSAHRAAWLGALVIRRVERNSSFPNRARLSISATKEQLDKVAANELSPVEFIQQAQIRCYEPQK